MMLLCRAREASVATPVYKRAVLRTVTVACAALVAGASVASSSAASATAPGRLGPFTAPIAADTHANVLAVAPDHRVLLAGAAGVYERRTFLRALGPDLMPDPTFGAGGEVHLPGAFREPVAMAIEPDGQILLVRSGDPPTLYRLDRDGTPDGSFGSGEAIDVGAVGGRPVLSAHLALYPDGRILVAYRPFAGDGQPPSPVQLRRYLADGSPDQAFGSGGHVEQPVPGPGSSAAVALQPDGGTVLAVPSHDARLSIMRFAQDGQVDPGFGRGGLAGVAVGRRRWAPHVHPGGAPLVTSSGRVRIPITYGERESVMRLGIVGLNAEGAIDRRFGRLGLALGPRQPYTQGGERASMAVRDAHGGTLVAGSLAHADDLSGDDAAIVRRFRPDGALDLSFGRRGLLRMTLRGGGSPLEQLVTMLDGETAALVVQEQISKYDQWSGGVVRTFAAGYDRDEPVISLEAGCRWMRIRIRDVSALERVVLRVDGRVVRRTTRKTLRLRVRPGLRVSVTAVDTAGNRARAGRTLPAC